MRCSEHGVKIYLDKGVIRCMACHAVIPMKKLKKKN